MAICDSEGGTLGYSMAQVPSEGGIKDALGHLGDGANALALNASIAKGTTGTLFAKSGQEGKVASEGIQASKKAFTEPTLPPKIIVEQDGVKIVHYTKSGDHGPPHVHVKGGGTETRIGSAGKPLRNNPALTAQQSDVVSQFKSEINKAIKKIGRYFDYNNK